MSECSECGAEIDEEIGQSIAPYCQRCTESAELELQNSSEAHRFQEKPSSRFPVVVLILVVLNSMIFLGTVNSSFTILEEITLDYAFVPAYFFSDPVNELYSIFTSMFLHANIAHIAMNMVALLVVGRAVESSIGHGRFLSVYIISGIGAVLIFSIVELSTNDGMSYLVGASGAISGIIGASVILGNRGAIVWLAIQLVLAFVSSSMGGLSGIAFMAHVGGFVTGLIVTKVLMRSEKLVELGHW